MAKTSTSFRLSPEVKRLIAKLAKRLGVSKTDVLELAVRKMDETEKDGGRS